MQTKNIFKAVLVAVFLVTVSACTTVGPNLVENGQTSVETVGSEKVSIVKVKVNQQEEAAVVKGLVVRDSSNRFAKGYVTVDLYNEMGTRIDSVDAKVVYKRRGSKSNRTGSFRANLEETPPVHSRVVVRAKDKRKPSEDSKQGTMSIL